MKYTTPLRAGSCAIDFTQLGHQKCFGIKKKNESELKSSVSYLVILYVFFYWWLIDYKQWQYFW